MTVLGSAEIRRRILKDDLISNYVDLETQLQPNGFDMCVEEVFKFIGPGMIDFSNEKRRVPDIIPLECQYQNREGSEGDFWFLKPGAYPIGIREKVNLSHDLRADVWPLMGDTIHRSTVMRCGAVSASGRWDVGYQGMGRSLLIVHNPHGLYLFKNARVIQMKFYHVLGTDKVYSGKYQNETYMDR